MYSLGVLLKEDIDKRVKEVKRRMMLRDRAIIEGRIVDALYDLALLVGERRDEVKDSSRTAQPYEHAVTKPRIVSAVLNPGTLRTEGVDVGKRSTYRGLGLHERANVEDRHVSAVINSASLLGGGEDGAPRDVPRAVSLYKQAVGIGNGVNGKLCLAHTLRT